MGIASEDCRGKYWFSPLALVTPHVECCVQRWAPEDKRDMDILDWLLQSAAGVINGLKHLCYEEAERAGIAQPGGQKAQGHTNKHIRINTC